MRRFLLGGLQESGEARVPAIRQSRGAAGILAAASPAAGCAGSWLAGSRPAVLAAPCCARVMIRSAADGGARQSGNVLLRSCWSSRYGGAGGACRPVRAENRAQNHALRRTVRSPAAPGRMRTSAGFGARPAALDLHRPARSYLTAPRAQRQGHRDESLRRCSGRAGGRSGWAWRWAPTRVID